MIEFGKITGEVEGNFIQVKLRTGECLFAPVTIVGTDVSLPSEDWITANKDNFLALVTYEKDMYISPMVIGFYPVKGADSSSYNTTERLLAMVTKLIEQLLKAKVNTMLGPQPFMPDSMQVFTEIKQELDEISKLILPLKK
jgi:hypothetical protein